MVYRPSVLFLCKFLEMLTGLKAAALQQNLVFCVDSVMQPTLLTPWASLGVDFGSEAEDLLFFLI